MGIGGDLEPPGVLFLGGADVSADAGDGVVEGRDVWLHNGYFEEGIVVFWGDFELFWRLLVGKCHKS